MRVALFVTCLVDQLLPEVGVAAARVLRRAGHEVEFPLGQTCCGQPAFNAGFHPEARRVMRQTVTALHESGAEAIVAPAGSCTTMLRVSGPELLPGDEAMRAVAQRTHELSEFLDLHGREAVAGHFPHRVAYHDSCHMLRELGIARQPRELLGALDGCELVEWDAERCCGFGGTFSVRDPELSVAMADEKLRTLGEAEILCGSDPACLMHMRSRLERLDSEVRVMHLAEVLEQASAGATP